MTELTVLYCLLLLTYLDSASQIRPSLHGHNNGFVQDENDVQYLLDNMPITMHKEFSDTVHGTGDNASEEEKVQDSLSHIHFEPKILDFKERELGIPHQETVTLFNKDHKKVIHLSSISGNTRHFHSSFFQNKVVPPLGNTTFNVVFLGREEGGIKTHLSIHTSEGTIKYQVRGVSISSIYRLRPVLDVKLPLNASFTPFVYIHNPHSEALQVVEVYSSGGEVQLDLPSGESEGSRELWEIPPYQTKPIIRIHFIGYAEKNHTSYIRFKMNNTSEILVVAVEIEVTSGAGLHWGGNFGLMNFGIGGSLQPPTHYPIALKNSAKKPIKVVNVIVTPLSKALKLYFDPIVVPADTDIPVAIGTLIYDWKTGLELQHFKGKVLIKAIGPGGSSQKLAIPWEAQVLQGGLEVNASVAHYCSPQSNQAHNFSVVNRFKVPLAITNVTMSSTVETLFTITNFIPRIIMPEQKVSIFSFELAKERKTENVKMESSILIHSNVSVTEVPLLSYDGKVKRIVPGEIEEDKGVMNFGTLGTGTENEAIFALENQNPVNVELHGWGVNMPGAVLELMGCQSGSRDLLDTEFRNVSVCSYSGNQYIKPGYLAVFKIKVKTPMVEKDAVVGDVFVRTTYERFILPVYMQVAQGTIILKKIVFPNCFPGSVCIQQVRVHSTFAKPMEVTRVIPIHKDDRIKYIPLEDATMPVINRGENLIGSIQVNPSAVCKHLCYLGLSLNTNAGSQWLNTMTLPSHTRDTDLNLLNVRYSRFLNYTKGTARENVTMRLDTTEVRGYKFYLDIKPYWPSLVASSEDVKNRSITFPLTQVGNTSYETITLHNPSEHPIFVQLVMDWNYPQGAKLYHSLPAKLKLNNLEFPSTTSKEFKLEESIKEREWFEKEWNVVPAPQSFPLLLNPLESKTIQISYTPSTASLSSAFLYIRNNMTILEVIHLTGQGASAQLRVGNKKLGSSLLFELTEKHLKFCKLRAKQTPAPNLTVKQSFTAKNTGQLSIDIYGFYINGLNCEGYGFKVLNCFPFKLSPNATRKIDIAFTPDFTLSRIERNLLITTSLGSDGVSIENGVLRLNLLASVPAVLLKPCTATLMRPSWEQAVKWAAISISSALLICMLVLSFFEADRILRATLTAFVKENSTQPPLDLRLLAYEVVPRTRATSSQKEKPTADEKPKATKKEEAYPDWTLMNVKKCKDKDMQKGIKIPDWSAEEEKRFRMDTESKDLLSFKRFEETALDSSNNISNVPLGTKKKNNKKQNNIQEVQTESCIGDNVTLSDSQSAQEKKSTPISCTKSSPVTNRKGKLNHTASMKEDLKLIDHEVQVDTIGFLNSRSNKQDTKRKQSASGNSNSHNNHMSFKKFDVTSSQKNVQLSEEETSSTTTESSINDDTSLCKSFDQTCTKSEKLQRKSATKKTKPPTIPSVPCVDYKDNYEGDCDDDEYDKEKRNNPNRWKTSTTRSTAKHHIHASRTVESSFRLPRQNKNPPRKEKPLQKRRGAEKIHTKGTLQVLPTAGTINQKEEGTRSLGTSSTTLPPPPSYWGENRARFSDVVARNQETMSSFATTNKAQKDQTTTHNVSPTFTNDIKDTEYIRQQPSNQEIQRTIQEFKLPSNTSTDCAQTEKERPVIRDSILLQTNSQHSNSYFVNAFSEPAFERELVPYDDLPETDELLVELESPEEDTRCQLWEDNSPMINLLPESTSGFQLESSKSSEKVTDISDTLRDNWATVETNWEPLYTRAAVGEERSGVWGVNTGGVWAAAPWGAAAQSSTTQLSSLQSESDTQERSGFDPFRSLSTIWTPSSTESWKKKHED